MFSSFDILSSNVYKVYPTTRKNYRKNEALCFYGRASQSVFTPVTVWLANYPVFRQPLVFVEMICCQNWSLRTWNIHQLHSKLFTDSSFICNALLLVKLNENTIPRNVSQIYQSLQCEIPDKIFAVATFGTKVDKQMCLPTFKYWINVEHSVEINVV